jgi:hypothetical protein
MPDLDNQTLFGEDTEAELVPWPHGYGNTPLPWVRGFTLFGEPALWRAVAWPEGYGPA